MKNIITFSKNIKIITSIKGVWRDVKDILHGNPNCNVVSRTFVTSNQIKTIVENKST
jgi:hypothetical protein